ncbi:hypothetical protein DUNSADRAFT_2154 [Dunaliella salina]|uniref:BTB domain-containing protein n=1 Tax=Dunaliella salina TaxID=3046 RepID=A0ABQ7H8E2_DUNSA|nr:hypothetical protein DUNSADRAFT_2154 [Dunaliella salina]|eukprot:KAF5843117.1 hypothetical protein DUNSADRAFT_2154 [Dunaliella salina]
MLNPGPSAWAYDNEALSDVTIAFVPKGAVAFKTTATWGQKLKAKQEGHGVDDPQPTRTLPGHRFVLASYSDYYRALFLRWTKEDEMVKLEYSDADDLAAAQTCIKAMYLQKLDYYDLPEPQNAVPLLIKVIGWADMLQAPTCIELCVASLADCFQPGSAEDVNWMLQGLPDSVRCSPAFVKVQEVCQKWLQRSFTDVYEVITEDGLRKAFLQLSPQAVHLWMKCDNLIGTENDVIFAVTNWHEGEQGKTTTEKDLVALSRQVRVSQLAQSVRECVLPTLPWFKKGHLLPIFATAFRRLGTAAPKELTSVSISPSWTAPARGGNVPDMAGVMGAREWFVLRVPISDVTKVLEEMVAEDKEYSIREPHHSDEFYSNGATFSAYLELKLVQRDAELTIFFVNESGHILDVSYSIRQSCPGRYGIGTEDQVIDEGKTLLDACRGNGYTVAGPTASLMPLLQEQAVDGHLVFKIKMLPI